MNSNEVIKIAELARIGISEADAEKFSGDLSQIISWVEKLDEVDVSGIEPQSSKPGETVRMRDDEADRNTSAEPVLSNAPQAGDGYFMVPKVIEGNE